MEDCAFVLLEKRLDKYILLLDNIQHELNSMKITTENLDSQVSRMVMLNSKYSDIIELNVTLNDNKRCGVCQVEICPYRLPL